jgi:hypothetical protein
MVTIMDGALYEYSEKIFSWMINEFTHWPKPYLLLSPTCDEIFPWMIEIWMKKHLVSDSNCNNVNLYSPKKPLGMTNNVGLTFSVRDTLPCFTISVEQDN